MTQNFTPTFTAIINLILKDGFKLLTLTSPIAIDTTARQDVYVKEKRINKLTSSRKIALLRVRCSNLSFEQNNTKENDGIREVDEIQLLFEYRFSLIVSGR